MKRLSILLPAILALVFVACEQRPKYVLSSKKMEQVLYDYHLAQGLVAALPYDERENSPAYIQDVFDRNGITPEQFDSSLVYYNSHTKELQKIYANLFDRFTELEKGLHSVSGSNEMQGSYSEDSDTTEIWTGRRTIVLHANRLQNIESFVIKADSTFRMSDQFVLSAQTDFISDDQNGRIDGLFLAIAVRHRDGKTTSSVVRCTTSGLQQLKATAQENKQFDSVHGYFFYQGRRQGRNIGIVSNISLLRIHTLDESAAIIPLPDSLQVDTLAADSLQLDSLNADSLQLDSLDQLDTSDDAGKKQLRLSPDEIREHSSSAKQPNIKLAPETRTPNSIGPRRRMKRQPQR